jgi:hypothetical protein
VTRPLLDTIYVSIVDVNILDGMPGLQKASIGTLDGFQGDQELAKECISRLQKMARYGPRCYLPSIEEIQAIQVNFFNSLYKCPLQVTSLFFLFFWGKNSPKGDTTMILFSFHFCQVGGLATIHSIT